MNRANFEVRVREKLHSGIPKKNYFEAHVTMENGRVWIAKSGAFPEDGSRDFQFKNLLDILRYQLSKYYATHETEESEGQGAVA